MSDTTIMTDNSNLTSNNQESKYPTLPITSLGQFLYNLRTPEAKQQINSYIDENYLQRVQITFGQLDILNRDVININSKLSDMEKRLDKVSELELRVMLLEKAIAKQQIFHPKIINAMNEQLLIIPLGILTLGITILILTI